MSEVSQVALLNAKEEALDTQLAAVSQTHNQDIQRNENKPTDATPDIQVQEKSSGGGCSGIMKIVVLVIAAVVSYFVPAAAPAAIQLATAVLSEGQMSESDRRRGVDTAGQDARKEQLAEQIRQDRQQRLENFEAEQAGLSATDLSLNANMEAAGEIAARWGVPLIAEANAYFEANDLGPDSNISNLEAFQHADALLDTLGFDGLIAAGIDPAIGLTDEQAQVFIEGSTARDEPEERNQIAA
ncbi:MAG: hypothetical protein AB8C46_07920 [Burkholderiaceae bacterium]